MNVVRHYLAASFGQNTDYTAPPSRHWIRKSFLHRQQRIYLECLNGDRRFKETSNYYKSNGAKCHVLYQGSTSKKLKFQSQVHCTPFCRRYYFFSLSFSVLCQLEASINHDNFHQTPRLEKKGRPLTVSSRVGAAWPKVESVPFYIIANTKQARIISKL